MARALRTGGRVFYVGAGTSGRLATLDASECPPTFGVPPSWFQAVIAGGRRALWSAVEGAEDSAANGGKDISARRITRRDVVVGLTASGSTPYVLGALAKARRAGALTIGITSNRNSPLAKSVKILIAPETGPEALTGSTRLKAGTAQKLVLNMLSTATMVRLGRVYENWMIGVALTNKKLKQRGLRILEQATGASVSDAARALRQAGHDPCIALIILKKTVTPAEAARRLRASHGNMREALKDPTRTGAHDGQTSHPRRRRLEGTVRISGAKNAALPAMTAAMLTSEPVHLQNIPRVRDIVTMGRLLAHMGAHVEVAEFPATSFTIRTEQVNDAEAPYELVRTMRASVLTLGPLVGRWGRARVSLPGGCAIGARPVDLHLKGARTNGRGNCH